MRGPAPPSRHGARTFSRFSPNANDTNHLGLFSRDAQTSQNSLIQTQRANRKGNVEAALPPSPCPAWPAPAPHLPHAAGSLLLARAACSGPRSPAVQPAKQTLSHRKELQSCAGAWPYSEGTPTMAHPQEGTACSLLPAGATAWRDWMANSPAGQHCGVPVPWGGWRRHGQVFQWGRGQQEEWGAAAASLVWGQVAGFTKCR